ncbi:heme-dependent catalase [Penicillium cosmopolitanum]|uniref:Heme-dependent catalase n=1 Tax=Penicillium cosmopolitanum TaxID=1131564 RepID=A0A9W9SJ52_9EURO|nr:heme-dependent catalase [Penicillium cosmopolitanum]KAJ5379546.1 heme-dependent catalase [Penicillium cosmopolitanum]
MPLPSDPVTVDVGAQLVDTLHKFFGPHPGFRPARFSSSTGLPELPDTDPNGNPRGLAIRFVLAESPRRVHTDIITHSTPFFPAKDGPDALAFFKALANGSIVEHLAAFPSAKAFVEAPKPFPVSFATENYYGVNAFKLIAADGTVTFIRYRIVPRVIRDALPLAPAFDLVAQIAEEGDVTDNCTVRWPESRKIVTLGTISLESVKDDNAAEQKRVIFDPVPRVQGVESSDDPLIDVRAALYLISGRERRAA